MSHDAATQTFADDGIPMDFQRMIILSSYCEFMGKRTERTDPSQNHMTILQAIATETKLLLGRKGGRSPDDSDFPSGSKRDTASEIAA